jgi:hypothetical protein
MDRLIDGLFELAVKLTVLGAGAWLFQQWIGQLLNG